MISALICVSLRWVWHIYNLPCISALFWLFSVARNVVRSPRICFWGAKYDVYCERFAYLHSISWCRARLWPELSASTVHVDKFLLNMPLEISNIYSLLLYRYLFWYFLGGGRGEGGGGVLIFRLIAWWVLKICMDLGGGYKKTSRWKKNPLPPPVGYIMNAALLSWSVTVYFHRQTCNVWPPI